MSFVFVPRPANALTRARPDEDPRMRRPSAATVGRVDRDNCPMSDPCVRQLSAEDLEVIDVADRPVGVPIETAVEGPPSQRDT